MRTLIALVAATIACSACSHSTRAVSSELSWPEAESRLDSVAEGADWTTVADDPQQQCERDQGHWMEFGTTAADTCIAHLTGTDGGDAMTKSCNCGKRRCWLARDRRARCVQNPS